MSRRIWLIAAMWIMWFIRRLPARESRWRFCSPEDASRGAVPVQEANRLRSANRVTSPTSARILAATTGPTPWRSIRCEPRASTMALSSAVAFLILASTAISSASSSAAMRRRVLPAMSRGRTRGEHRLGLAGGDVAFGLPRKEFCQQRLESVDGLDPAPGECFAAVGEHPQRLELPVELQHPQGLGADRDGRDRVGIVGVGLAVVAGVEEPDPGRELRGDVDDLFAVFEESLRERSAGTVAALDRPDPVGPGFA